MTYVSEGSVTGVGILFAVLSIACVFGRFESRRRWKSGYGIDDWLIIPAEILVLASALIMVIGAQAKVIGGHSPTQSGEAFHASELDRQVLLEKYEYALILIQQPALGLIKLSILFFYRRLFRGNAKITAFDISNWALIGITLLLLVSTFFASLFACRTHFSAIWGSISELKKYCVNTFWLNTILAIINFLMDLAVLIEPLFMIWNLKMNRNKRVRASCVFLVAILAVAAACVKMVSWIKITVYDLGSGKPLLGLPNGNDDIGVVSILLFWNFIEMGVGIVVACLPSHNRFLELIYSHSVKSWQTYSLQGLMKRRSRTLEDERAHGEESGESIQLDIVAHDVLQKSNGSEASAARQSVYLNTFASTKKKSHAPLV